MRYLAFLVFVIISLNSCFLSSTDCFRDYLFALDFTLSPAKDTFFVGDTIWVSSTIPEELLDMESQEMVNVSNVDFIFRLRADQIDTLDFAPAEQDFDYIEKQGSLRFLDVSTWTEVYPQYEKTGQEQCLYFGIIPKRTATYDIHFIARTTNLENINLSDCIDEMMLYYYINGGDGIANNYHLMENSDNDWVSVNFEFYEKGGHYSFVVIE